MAYRRILFLLTALSALLLVGSLGMVVHNRAERADQPARIELSRSLMSILEQLNDRVEALVVVQDLPALRPARQDLAQALLAFDQDLLAAGETVRDEHARGAIAAIQTIWRDLGLRLADLAAGEYAPNSAAGEKTIALLRRENPVIRQHLNTASAAMHAAARQAGRLGGAAAAGAAVLGGLTLLLGIAASRPPRLTSEAAACCGAASAGSPAHEAPYSSTSTQTPASDANPGAFAGPDRHAPGRTAAFNPARPAGPLAAHGDLGLASAAVDRIALDMGTVARSADRMQQAVDSVASALHGMLFSLNEMAQDTFEGSRLTRSAHNAAIYAADTARELLESAREMGTVVARVRTLAARSQEIAGRIEAEAAATGATGEAFTSVVAQEVKQLAAATADATQHIEATVDEILAGQRQYEEAIGQIIRNIGAVRKVAASMGELMLAPPLHVQPGTGYAAASAPAAAAMPAVPNVESARAPAPAPSSLESAPAPDETTVENLSDILQDELNPFEPDAAEVLQEAQELAAVTEDLLDELADATAETDVPAPQPETPETVQAAEPLEAPETAQGEQTEKPAPPAGSNGNVFMLNRPKKPIKAEKPQEAPASAEPPQEAPEPVDAAPAPEPAPEAAPPEPTPEAAPVAEAEAESEAETVGAAAGAAKPRPVAQGASGNIFMLNKPKK